MEKAKNLMTVPFNSKWSDLGDWGAVWTELSKDQSGTALSEAAHAIDCSNTLLRSESLDQHIIGLGLIVPYAALLIEQESSLSTFLISFFDFFCLTIK